MLARRLALPSLCLVLVACPAPSTEEAARSGGGSEGRPAADGAPGAEAAAVPPATEASAAAAQPGADTSSDAASTSDANRAQPAEPPFTHRATTTADLTGDGIPDTLAVVASGAEPLGIDVALTIRSAGRELYRATWESHEYFRYEPELAMSDDEAAKYAHVRVHLEQLLEPAAFARLDPGAPNADPEGGDDPDDDPVRLISGQLLLPFLLDSLEAAGVDSTRVLREARSIARGRTHPDAERLWAGLSAAAAPTFTFHAGGENTRRVAWSGEAERFLTVWSCC